MTETAPLPLRPPLATTNAPRDLEPSAKELEMIKKWQEERIERKFKGEYESLVVRLGDLINDNLKTPMKIASVRVDGASTSRPSFLNWLVRPHLERQASLGEEASDVHSVLTAARNITQTLRETDVFASVEPRIEAAKSYLANEGDVDLVFLTRTKGRYFLKTATEIGDQEGSVNVQARTRNTFGGAETLEATFSSGIKTRLAGQLSLSAPLTPDLKTTWEAQAFGVERDYTNFASCFEGVRGFKAIIRSAPSRTSVYEIAYEAAVRHVRSLLPTASISVREQAGYSSKSSLSHTWLYDTRNDRAVASRGVYFRSFQEFAGLGGDAAFVKSQFGVQASRHVLSGSILSFGGKAGVLLPLFGRTPLFTDRFQLGGPHDVRQFRINGLGPRDGPDSLGGDVYWAAGLSVISDLPIRPSGPVKLHVFLNAGRLDAFDKSRPKLDTISDCISKPSIAAGVGLMYKLDPVRVELNFGVPIVASKSDGSRRGFQLGIGLDFL